MKKIGLIILAFFLLSSLSSCSVTRSNIKTETAFLSVKIFQTLDEYSALAFTDKYDVVKLQSSRELYYDRKKVSGRFTLVNTYRYINNEGEFKTVPVYVRSSELRQSSK